MMEQKLDIESIQWFEKSKSSMTLLKEFFDERLEIETKVDLLWKSYFEKWQKRFKEVEDPMKVSDQSVSEMMKVMVDETRDNSVICCSVKSLLKRKRQNASAVLGRWLNDPTNNTSCIDIDEFKETYITTVTNMEECQRNVDKSLQTLQKKTAALQHVVAQLSTAPALDVNRSIALAKKEEKKARKVDQAKESYQEAVFLHKQARPPYVQTMTYLGECLESYEQNRLATMQRATRLYLNAINQYEMQRETRRRRIDQLLDYFESVDVNKMMKNWLSCFQEPCNFPEYLDHHPVLALGHGISRRIHVPPQIQSQIESTPEEVKLRHADKQKVPDSRMAGKTNRRIEVAPSTESEQVFLRRQQATSEWKTSRRVISDQPGTSQVQQGHTLIPMERQRVSTSVLKSTRRFISGQPGTSQDQQRPTLMQTERTSTPWARGYLVKALRTKGESYWMQNLIFGPVAKEFWTSAIPKQNRPVTKSEQQSQKSPDSVSKSASPNKDQSLDSQMALESVESPDFTYDGKHLNKEKMFKSSNKDIDDARTPVEQEKVPKPEMPVMHVMEAQVLKSSKDQPGNVKADIKDFNTASPAGPELETPVKKAWTVEADEDQPESTLKTESSTSQGTDDTDVATAARVKVYAIDSYTSGLPGHLSFRTGQKIKQKRAANEEGFAYGYIVKNKLTRKRAYGLYPVTMVAVKVPRKKTALRNFFRKK